jgi:hypothetical protein
MSRTPSFPNPLDEAAFRQFAHPDPASPLHPLPGITLPDGTRAIAAGNGYIALQATRALVLWSDLPQPAPEFLTRWLSLPWERYPAQAPAADWRPVDTFRASLYKRGTLAPWQEKRHAPAPAPVVQVASHLLRLSHLQLISRLPACQIHTRWQGNPQPGHALWFRFAGGHGVIPQDSRLICKVPAFTLSMPRETP